jgi:hypothetical protein
VFNWASAPTFAAMLLFWLLAAYVLTRSPRSAISLTAVGAQVGTACYLLGNGMAANAETADQWVSWTRPLQSGAVLAPVLWYWLTALLLAEQAAPPLQCYVRRVAYPLGIALAVASVVLTISVYVDDWLSLWSQVTPLPSERITYSRFHLPAGPLYPWFVGYLVATTVGAAVNVFLGWRQTLDEERRRRLAWLLLSALLFVTGANLLGLVNLLTDSWAPTWVGHVVLAAAMLVMAWNVAAYSLLLKDQVIRTDFFYFLTALTTVCLVYGLVFIAARLEYSFWTLGLVMVTLIVTILTHAMVDLGRRALDRLFFGSEVQRLRSNLAAVAQDAALTPNLDVVLTQAQAEIAGVSADLLVRLTEQALRRLNNPAALARCDLLGRLPHTLRDARSTSGIHSGEPTALEQAQALREVLVAAIERLKPLDGDHGIGSPAALQYNILREEYLQGLLNKQIMTRHSISEGTFNRNRRQAIWTLAQELQSREERLARETIAL